MFFWHSSESAWYRLRIFRDRLMGFLHTREVEVAVVLPDLHKTKQNLSLRILLWTSVFKMCMLSGLLKLSTFVFCYNNCFSLFIPEGIFGVQTHKAAPPSLLIFLVDSIEKNATLVNGFMWLFGQKYLSTLREKKKKRLKSEPKSGFLPSRLSLDQIFAWYFGT